MNKIIKKIIENKHKKGWSLIYNGLYSTYLFALRILPAKRYVKIVYKQQIGKKLNLNNPQTLTEKLQWRKLYDRKPLYTLLADKYAVRDYVSQRIDEKYLIPLLFQTKNPEEIDFHKLPIPCIIKPTHCSGHTIILRDKKDIDREKIIAKCKKWLKMNYYKYSREWQYKNIPPRIIIEKLILDEKGKIPTDYKFHCFKGKVEFISVHSDRFEGHKETYFNRDWKFLPFIWCPKINGKPKYEIKKDVIKPKNLKEMIKIAEILSKDFDYIRVDLYSVNNDIYFGELTICHGGGFSPFIPEKWDLKYGKKFKLPLK